MAFIGDAINDYCILKKVGLFFAVADAGKKIRDEVDCVLKTVGGGGGFARSCRNPSRSTANVSRCFRTICQ